MLVCLPFTWLLLLHPWDTATMLGKDLLCLLCEVTKGFLMLRRNSRTGLSCLWLAHQEEGPHIWISSEVLFLWLSLSRGSSQWYEISLYVLREKVILAMLYLYDHSLILSLWSVLAKFYCHRFINLPHIWRWQLRVIFLNVTIYLGKQATEPDNILVWKLCIWKCWVLISYTYRVQSDKLQVQRCIF